MLRGRVRRTKSFRGKADAMPDATFWLSLAVLGVVVVLSIVQGRAKDQIGRVERKLDLLLKHAQIDLTAVADREAAGLVRAGSKIEAIRVYCEPAGGQHAHAVRPRRRRPA